MCFSIYTGCFVFMFRMAVGFEATGRFFLPSTLDASGQNICLESDTTYKQFDFCGDSFSPQLGKIQNLATLQL